MINIADGNEISVEEVEILFDKFKEAVKTLWSKLKESCKVIYEYLKEIFNNAWKKIKKKVKLVDKRTIVLNHKKFHYTSRKRGVRNESKKTNCRVIKSRGNRRNEQKNRNRRKNMLQI